MKVTISYERNFQIEPYLFEKFSIQQTVDIEVINDDDEALNKAYAEMRNEVLAQGQASHRLRQEQRAAQKGNN